VLSDELSLLDIVFVMMYSTYLRYKCVMLAISHARKSLDLEAVGREVSFSQANLYLVIQNDCI
jgi:hypothetical protein